MRLLLLHGAGLGSWIWDRVLPHLTAPAEAIDLPGRSNPREVTLPACVDAVVGRVHASPEPCVLVGHSISAEIALAVAANDRTRVASIVLIGGVVPESGKSFLSTLPLPQRLFLGVLLRRAKKGIALPKAAVEKGYCNDLDEETTELVLSRVVREAPRLYLDPVPWGDVRANLPRIYVKLTKDKSVSVKQQERFLTRVHATSVASIDSGHLPMLGRPDELARILNSLK